MILTAANFIDGGRVATWRRDGNAFCGGILPGANLIVEKVGWQPDRRSVMVVSMVHTPPVHYDIPEVDLRLFMVVG
jgi:hypothetical protein